jgi:membrane-bound lytic murein transglycosylase D
MKKSGILSLLLLLPMIARADDNTVSLPELLTGAQQWAQQNLDTNAINAINSVGIQAEQNFLSAFQQQFQGRYVVNLASLRQAALNILPLLESREETQPYAAWLRAQMDYLDVAEEFRLSIPPPAKESSAPPPILANPGPQKEREMWTRKLSGRPWPPLAKPYMAELKSVFKEVGIPPELVWVAEVESGFDRRALSPVGAAGLFQLMPDTARRFGLSLWPFDQRYQTKPSATASARYLKYLYEHFRDWRLALAAYNAGEGTVQKLLDHYNDAGYDTVAGHLPAETQMYVPRVAAVISLRENRQIESLPAPRS